MELLQNSDFVEYIDYNKVVKDVAYIPAVNIASIWDCFGRAVCLNYALALGVPRIVLSTNFEWPSYWTKTNQMSKHSAPHLKPRLSRLAR